MCPLAFNGQNRQDGILSFLFSSGRKTKFWIKGDKITYGMYLKQGTVLASGWEGDHYKSKPPGNHVVVFDKYGVDGQRRLGMYVAEQLANKRGNLSTALRYLV